MFIVIASGMLAGGGVILAGVLLIDNIVEDATSIALKDVENRLDILDATLSRVERDSSKTGRDALAALAAQYPSIESAKSADIDSLRQDAIRLGVDEIYFIANDGTIEATSFGPDTGFNLFSLGPKFAGFLKGIIGSGRFINQRISMSTHTSQANSYQYYGPLGKDYIIEVSTRLHNAVAKTFPGHDLTSLLSLLFNTGDAGDDYIVKATDLIWGHYSPYRSLLSESAIAPELQMLVRDASLNDGQWTESKGRNSIIVRRLHLSNDSFDFSDGGFFIMFKAKRSLAYDFIQSSIAVSGLLIMMAIVVIYVLSKKSFNKRVTSRLESLEEAMGRIALGDEETSLDDGAGDEISSICRSAENMVAQIRERNAELLESHAANDALIHELDHRVHNNLQLAMSLASMQSRTTESTPTKDALERMRSRLAMMSMVQDHAINKTDYPDINMSRLFYDICAEVSGYHGLATAGIRRNIEVENLFLKTEIAIAIGLIASEVIDNAFRHAFDSKSSGILTIRSTISESSLIITFDDDGEGSINSVSVGLEIALALSEQLGASLTWVSEEGHSVTLSIPIMNLSIRSSS